MVHFIGKGQHRLPLHRLPVDAQGARRLYPAENVPANEFLNLEGDKISTSRNWAVWLHEYLEEFPGKEDVLRYVLCANAPETKDNDFTWKDFQARNNNELVAVLGNFVNRALVLTRNITTATFRLRRTDRLRPRDAGEVAAVKASLEANIEHYRFREALKDAMNIARIGNKYLPIPSRGKSSRPIPNGWRPSSILPCRSRPIRPLPSNLHALLRCEDPEDAGCREIRWEHLGTMDLIAAGHKIGGTGFAVRENRRRRDSAPPGQTCGDQRGQRRLRQRNRLNHRKMR